MLKRLATVAESIAAALLLAAVALNFANVIARYAFGRPIITAEEILQFSDVWIVMLAAAAVTYHGTHLRLDVLVPTGRPQLLRVIELAIAALGVGLAVYVCVNALRIISLTYATGQRSVAAEIPLMVVYFAVPTGFACTLIFLLNRVWRLARAMPDDQTTS